MTAPNRELLQTVTVPANRELLIQLPESAIVDAQAEVIVLFESRSQSREGKIAAMRKAARDPLFLADLNEVMGDFQ